MVTAIATLLSSWSLWTSYVLSISNTHSFSSLALPSPQKVLCMITLANLFIKEKKTTISHHEGLQSNITTFQTLVEFSNLVPKFSSRFTGALSRDFSISLPNASSSPPLSFQSMAESNPFGHDPCTVLGNTTS